MMHEEFERIAGYEVTFADYNDIIEPMYMALPNVSKQDFVKMIDRKRFALPAKAEIVRDMKRRAQFLFENCGRAAFVNEEAELYDIAKAYAKRFFGSNAVVTINTEHAYCGGWCYSGGCTCPTELLVQFFGDYDWQVYTAERIELVKGV